MCIEAKVAEKYYTNYNSDKDWFHPWNKQYVDLVKIWGNCSEGHIMCACPPSAGDSNHRIIAAAAIDNVLSEKVLNEALTSTSLLIRERAKTYKGNMTNEV